MDPGRFCGFLVLDKPEGITSHGCVAAVRRAYGLRRVGHGGTLDPAVTGVLPIALGPATRLLPYLQGSKVYRGVVQLGVRTSSDDLQGKVLERQAPPPLADAALERVLDRFRGPILQRPPQVSAVHVDGERAYARARRGETSELSPRAVCIERLVLLGWDPGSGRLEIEVACSAGTYIRALARDIGDVIGCGGALESLRRTAALGFDLSTAVPLERLSDAPPPPLQDPLQALAHLDQHRLSPDELTSWRCGRRLQRFPGEDSAAEGPDASRTEASLEGFQRSEASSPGGFESRPVAVLDPEGQLAGIAQSAPCGELRPRLVFDAAG